VQPYDAALIMRPCCEWSAGGTEALSVAVEVEEEEEEAHAGSEPEDSTPATGAGEPAQPQQPSLFQVNLCLLQAGK